MSHPLPGPVRVAASARSGLFTSADLSAAGVTEKEVRAAVRSGAWVRLRRGSFVTAVDLARLEENGGRHELDVLVVTEALAGPGRRSATARQLGCGVCRSPQGCPGRCAWSTPTAGAADPGT